ncbi:MAG: RNA methyltransferase [Acidobacteriota bacterium]
MIKSVDTSLRIVLVRPRNPNNIGAAARAMKNFGLTDLVIVAPHPPVWEEARRSSIGANDLIEGARVVETLIKAVSDMPLVIGTVDPRRGTGLTPARFIEGLSGNSGPIAIVFGSEKSGLTRADLSYCHRVVSIPTSDDCPSMNLGQAVAIICYELSQFPKMPKETAELEKGGEAASVGEVESLVAHGAAMLKEVGFLTANNEGRMVEEFRQSLLRMRLTSREVALWRGIVRKVQSRVRG